MYRQIGYVAVPREVQVFRALRLLYDTIGENNLDTVLRQAVLVLGKDNFRLNLLRWEYMPRLTSETFKNDGQDVRVALQIVVSDVLNKLGYIDFVPPMVDYVIDPVMSWDDLVESAIARRVPVPPADILGGAFANIETLASYIPEHVRRGVMVSKFANALSHNARRAMGAIGYRLLHGQQPSAQEICLLQRYSDPSPGSPGHSELYGNEDIRATDCQENYCIQALAEIASAGLPGPWYNHIRIASEGSQERMVVIMGPYMPELQAHYGAIDPFGPIYRRYETVPGDQITWGVANQLAAYVESQGTFWNLPNVSAIQTKYPHISVAGDLDIYKRMPLADDARFTFRVIDPTNCRLAYTWHSNLRERTIDSQRVPGIMDLALLETALASREWGGLSTQEVNFDSFGMCYLTENAVSRTRPSQSIEEDFLVPNGAGFKTVAIDMAHFYYRAGEIEVIPPFAEFCDLPNNWFLTEQPGVVDFVATQVGLSREQKVRLGRVISIYHNAAVYQRLTNKAPFFDYVGFSKMILNIQ